MAELKYLKRYSAETEICTLCGTCRTVCPVFLEEGIETSSTRGRISLINGLINGDLETTNNLTNKLHACLNCRRCIEICPANVNFTDLITSAKVDINLSKNKYLKTFFFKYLFHSKPTICNFSNKLLKWIRKHIYKNTNTLNLLGKLIFKLLRLPVKFIIPNMAEIFFFDMSPRHELIGEQKKRVALFLGCGGKYNYPESSDHLVELLRKNGIEVLIPENQVCCGSPLLDNGYLKLAKSNALKNLKVFNQIQDVSAIITQCSNCSYMLKQQYQNFLQVGKFRTPIVDIMQFIHDEKINLKPRYSSNISSHVMLRNHNDINKDNIIYDTIRSVYFKNYIEISSKNKCCGASELYKTANYGTRNLITNKFTNNYIDKEVSYIACTSFACIHKINEEFFLQNRKIRAVAITDIFE